MLSLEEIRIYCLQKPGVTESFPFDTETLVFKVAGKLFLLSNIEDPKFINLKCDPERAVQLREEHTEIEPGYHMNKKYWNSVSIIGNLSAECIWELIDHSYAEVIAKLPKAIRNGLSL